MKYFGWILGFFLELHELLLKYIWDLRDVQKGEIEFFCSQRVIDDSDVNVMQGRSNPTNY